MPESGGNDNFWNSLLTAAASTWASGKKKKEENKQLDWMNSILDDKRRYEEEKIARYKSSPGAQMSPMIMEMLVNAFGPKFKKYGIDMPLDKMLSAINGGSQAPSGASNGPSGGGMQQRSLSQIANGEEPQQGRTVADMIASQLGRDSNYTKQTGVKIQRGVDPEIEGYSGKTWNDLRDKNGGGGVSAWDVGGSREGTRKDYGSGEWSNSGGKKSFTGTGAAGDQIVYKPTKTNVTQWKDPKIYNGNFEGDGGGWDSSKSTPEQVIGGEASGPVDDKVGFLEWLQNAKNNHPVLWGIGKTVGNLLVPGLPNIASGAIDPLVARGFGDGQAGNAGITKTGNRKRGGKWGAN